MPSYQFTKFRVSIFMTCDADNQPLTENNVRKFVSDTILRTLDAGENPYYQALESDVHTFGSWGTYIPSVGSEEEMYDSYNRDILTEWIMQTDEMQEALSMFRGKRPKDKDDPEMRAWGYGHPQEIFSSKGFSETFTTMRAITVILRCITKSKILLISRLVLPSKIFQCLESASSSLTMTKI